MIGSQKEIFETSRHYDYAVYDNGRVVKIWRGKIERETPLNQYVDDDGVFVWVGKRKYYIKSLVARVFRGDEYRQGHVIEFIDNDPSNCAMNNLKFRRRDNSTDKRSYTKVMVDGVEYGSISSAEKALFVSHGYLTKYFKGQVSGKIIEGHTVELVEE